MIEILLDLAKLLFVFTFVMSVVPLLIWAERKISAGIQGRIGPNRVGPFGLLQPLADAIKLFFKEDITPRNVDKFFYNLAPIIAFAPPALIFAVVPFAKPFEVAGYEINCQLFHVKEGLDIGLVLFMSLVSIAVYGVAFAGWGSNNKYSLLGGLRASAQLISYELVFSLAIITTIALTKTLDLNKIVEQQAGGFWYCIKLPFTVVLFYIGALAENKRLPFDLPEAEAELVGGYHTEYSGMKFSMFMMGEYIAITSMSALMVTLFFGGWSIPGINAADRSVLLSILTFAVFCFKIGVIIFLYMWIRWTLPRFKYTELMKFSWKVLLPISLANFMLSVFIFEVLPKL